MTNETTPKTLDQFIADHGITMSVTPTDHNSHMENSETMDHWRCIIRKDGRRMELTFSMGSGHNGAEPTIADVLDCVASDASGAEGRSFEEWAGDYGYDTDSRKALKTYNVIVRQMRSLGRLLGSEAYSELLWNTERL